MVSLSHRKCCEIQHLISESQSITPENVVNSNSVFKTIYKIVCVIINVQLKSNRFQIEKAPGSAASSQSLVTLIRAVSVLGKVNSYCLKMSLLFMCEIEGQQSFLQYKRLKQHSENKVSSGEVVLAFLQLDGAEPVDNEQLICGSRVKNL